MKKYLPVLFLVIMVIPSVAMAAWWKPRTWKIFQRKELVTQKQVEVQKTPEEKINELQKQLDDLKNQQPTSATNTVSPVVKNGVKKTIPVIDNSAVIKAEVEAQAKIQAELDALIVKQKADAQARLDEETKQQAQQQANQKAQALQQELAQKQVLIAEMKSNCDDPINALKQNILDIKTKYFADLKELESSAGRRGLTTSAVDAQSIKLLNDANTKIQDLNNQIQQKALECSIKY